MRLERQLSCVTRQSIWTTGLGLWRTFRAPSEAPLGVAIESDRRRSEQLNTFVQVSFPSADLHSVLQTRGKPLWTRTRRFREHHFLLRQFRWKAALVMCQETLLR